MSTTSTIETRRLAPIHMSDALEMKYIQIPSYIINNEFDEVYEKNYTAPSLQSLRSQKEPESYNHEIRLVLDNPKQYSSDEENTIYYLPSACFSLFDSNTFSSIIDLALVKNLIPDTIVQSENSTVRKYDSSTKEFTEITITRTSDCVLSSLYNFHFKDSYKDDYNTTFYNFIISPYTNLGLSDDIIYPQESSVPFNQIYSTREFEVGNDHILYTNVSLLVHDRLLYDVDGDSNIPSDYFIHNDKFYTKLYWVGITLFYTNINENVCSSKNAVSLNVRLAENSSFKSTIPYFAIGRKKYLLTSDSYNNTYIPQYGDNKGNPIVMNTTEGDDTLHGFIYRGDAVLGSKIPFNNDTKEELQISTSISMSDILDNDTAIYIIMLPTKHHVAKLMNNTNNLSS